jgi:hypothetical protein
MNHNGTLSYHVANNNCDYDSKQDLFVYVKCLSFGKILEHFLARSLPDPRLYVILTWGSQRAASSCMLLCFVLPAHNF